MTDSMTVPMPALDAHGLVVRHPTMDDAAALHRLQAAVDVHDFGAVDMSLDDVRDELREISLETDAWVATPPDDRDHVVAYAVLPPPAGARFMGNVAVHPERRGGGIGSELARTVEARARERMGEAPAGSDVTLVGWLNGESERDQRWAAALGFERVRRFLRMRIDFDGAPPAPAWPEGITVRTFQLGKDEVAMYEALEEAFADHWGHVAMPFDRWTKRLDRSDFDPDLWLMAFDGDRVVGTSTNSVLPGDLGWISGLGVVRSHRRRGLARAILLQAFGDFWRRGLRSVALGVDAESLTGATGLYESVGMRVVESHDQVRKVLSTGTTG